MKPEPSHRLHRNSDRNTETMSGMDRKTAGHHELITLLQMRALLCIMMYLSVLAEAKKKKEGKKKDEGTSAGEEQLNK